ncbi:MAG: hypothetical protein AB1521_10775 [Bacteroidota bacterium]
MQKFTSIVVVFIFFLIVSPIISHAQNYGKIFTKVEAEKIFGKVTESQSFVRADFDKIMQGTEKTVMFKFIGGQLVILGDQRKLLYPESFKVDPKEQFYLFSKSMVDQLLLKEEALEIAVEHRQFSTTVTNRDFTLEESMICPPFCP